MRRRSLTFLQVVDFAARNSVVLLPKGDGHSVEGKRVYTFGKYSACVSGRVGLRRV